MSASKACLAVTIDIAFAVAVAGSGASGRLTRSTLPDRTPPAGSAVVVLPVAECGECPCCLEDKDGVCSRPVRLFGEAEPEEWQERMTIDPRLVLPVPEGISLRLAALVPAVGELLRALDRCALREREKLGILGNDEWTGLARLVAKASGIPLLDMEASDAPCPTVVLHLSPVEGSLAESINALGHVGRVVTMRSGNPGSMTIPDYYRQMIIKETSIIGSGHPSRADLAKAMALVQSRATDPRLLSLAGRFRIVGLVQ